MKELNSQLLGQQSFFSQLTWNDYEKFIFFRHFECFHANETDECEGQETMKLYPELKIMNIESVEFTHLLTNLMLSFCIF